MVYYGTNLGVIRNYIKLEVMMAEATTKKHKYSITLLLTMFLGGLGVHRFYTGYILIGIAQIVLMLLSGLGVIWVLIDLISLLTNNFKDANGQMLEGYDSTLSRVLRTFITVIFTLGILGVIVAIIMPTLIRMTS